MAKKKIAHSGKEQDHQHMGTHNDMVLRDDIVANLTINGETEKFTVIAEDKIGKYYTKPIYVGNGLLDPYRDPERRRSVTTLTEDAINKFFPKAEEVEA